MIIKRYISIIVGMLFLSLAVALWAMPRQHPESARNHHRIRVVLSSVETANTQRAAVFSGVTRAKNRAVLSFTVPARVNDRQVETGAQVRKGEILARLDDREFRNAVKLAQASVSELTTQREQAGRDRRRFEKLAASDVVSVSDLEQITTREAALTASLGAASARLKEAQRVLGESILKAPFAGTVTAIHIQPGEWALPGQPALELTGSGDVELLVEVPESMMARLTVGQNVQVQLPFAEGRRVPGRISSVAKAALTAGRLFPVKVDIEPAPGVTAGLTAQLLVDLSTEGVLTIPLDAVVNPGASQPYIFIYRNGTVMKRLVNVGGILGDRIIVTGNFSEGDRVVTSGLSQLADGDSVEVAL